jgi:hypothetical protein
MLLTGAPALGAGNDLNCHVGFCSDPYGYTKDYRRARLGVELGRVFFLQPFPSPWFEEDRHSIISSALFTDLVDDFVGDSHVQIVLVIFYCEELWLI